MLSEDMVRAIVSDRRRDLEDALRWRRWREARRVPRPRLADRIRSAADVVASALLPSR